MEENISNFVKKQLNLLLIEREENLNTFYKDLSPACLHNLEKSGQALQKLTVSNLINKGPERFNIDFQRNDGLPLEHVLSNGDLVICIRSKGKNIIKGIVNEIGDSSISISSNDQFEEIEEEEIFTLVKTDSDFTYKSQSRALNDLQKKNLFQFVHYDIIRILFETNKNEVSDLLLSEDIICEDLLDSSRNLKFSNKCLAKDQKAAVEFALKRKYIAVIQGPPGTGKTTTLIEIIIQLYRCKKKILVCAPTNVAVDNLALRLGDSETKPLRLGHPTRISKNVLKYSLDSYMENNDGFLILKDIKKSIRDIEFNIESNNGAKYSYKELRDLKKEYRQRSNRLIREILQKNSVILCTLNSSSPIDGQLQNLPKDYFDVLIVDEASQAMEASMWIAIPNAPKLILAGDTNQLPPVIMSQEAVKGGLSLSLMEKIIKNFGSNSFISLCKQYRMNEKIMTWSSKKFYDNILEADEQVKNHLLINNPSILRNSLTSEALVFIDTCGCECEEYYTGIESSSKGNLGEAVVVGKVAANLIKSGLSQKDIGIITPYSLQVDFIRRSFTADSLNIEVKTVDGFQGREKEVIILSLVRSNQDQDLGFVTDFRRLNVAVTRAKKLLIVIGDSETFEKNELVSSLLKHIEDYGLLQTAVEYFSENIADEIENISKSARNVKLEKNVKKTNKSDKSNKIETKEAKNKKIDLNEKKNFDAFKNNKDKDLSTNLNKKMYNVFEGLDDMQLEEKEEASGSISSTEIPNLPKNSTKSKKSKIKKDDKVEKINLISKDTEDFDKIVEEFSKSNYICSFERCKKSTKLIKLICEFCKKWYCLEHGLQEIHGCGDAIRRKEQKSFKHSKPDISSQKDKNKLSNKIKELQEARKIKKKSKTSK